MTRIKHFLEFIFFAPMMFPIGLTFALLVVVYFPLWLLGWLPPGW